MEEFLYRYVSFEAFVGMVQDKALTFVLPEIWDDPKEGAPFRQLISNLENGYERVMLYAIYNKTYAQCWTKLSESDAMWRIYSFNNRAIQIKVLEEKIKLLPSIRVVPVEYTDQIDFEVKNLVNSENILDAFLRSLAIKRCAFEHEKEVRIIKPYLFQDDEDIRKHYNAFCAMISFFKEKDGRGIEIMESMYPGQSVEDQADNVVKLLNLGNEKHITLSIPFDTIPNFIEGIKVHPFAPDWYVNIVKEFCKRNNVPFDGQSTLYSKE